MRIRFRLGLLVVVLSACAGERAPEEGPPPDPPPNIILIITDDQGYGDLGAHGNPWLKTPQLDSLHAASIRFTDFHVATTCAPTRAGLLSGVNCNRAGAWHTVMGRSFLGARYRTLADELREEGYATGIFGKWHLGDNYPFRPRDRGFDEVLIHGGGGVGQTPDAWNNDYFDDRYLHNDTLKRYDGYCTDVWFGESMRWMREAATSGRPFFAYVSTNAPHSPFHVGEEYAAPYRRQAAVVNPDFYGMIANLDDNIGRLGAMLRREGLAENTVLVFLTDNGSSAGARLDDRRFPTAGYNAGMRGMKGSQYEGGHRVPLFVHLPAGTGSAPGDRHELTAYTDLLPTLVELAGGTVNLPYALDGESLLPLLLEGRQAGLEGRTLVVDTQREDLPVRGKQSCVMRDRWRLIDGHELYDLATDPGQRTDVGAAHPELVAELNGSYADWWSAMATELATTHRIVIGNPAANPAVLTAHDWHTTAVPPWHQRHVREARVDNGYWALEVDRPGTYRFRLFRWPPETGRPLGVGMPPGQVVPGGKAYPEGLAVSPRSAEISCGGQRQQAPVAGGDTHQEFLLTLPEAGPTELQTWITDGEGVRRGAYYVEVERLE